MMSKRLKVIMPIQVPNFSVSVKLWKIKKRLQGLHIFKPAIQENEYWKGYQDALDHSQLILNRIEYEERRKIAESKASLNK